MAPKPTIRTLVKRAQKHLDALDAARAARDRDLFHAGIIALDLVVQELHAAAWRQAPAARRYAGERAFK